MRYNFCHFSSLHYYMIESDFVFWKGEGVEAVRLTFADILLLPLNTRAGKDPNTQEVTAKLTSTSLPCDFPFHAERVEPVQTQREAHHRHHDGYGGDKVAERRRAGDVDPDEVGRVVDLSVQHAASAKVTLRGGSTILSFRPLCVFTFLFHRADR